MASVLILFLEMCHTNGIFQPAFSKCLHSSHCTYHNLTPCGDVPLLNILVPRAAKRKCWFWGRLHKTQTCQCTLEEVLSDFNEPTLHTIPPFPRNSCSLCPSLGATGWWPQQFLTPGRSSHTFVVPAALPRCHKPAVSLRIINKRWWRKCTRSNSGGKNCTSFGADKGL